MYFLGMKVKVIIQEIVLLLAYRVLLSIALLGRFLGRFSLRRTLDSDSLLLIVQDRRLRRGFLVEFLNISASRIFPRYVIIGPNSLAKVHVFLSDFSCTEDFVSLVRYQRIVLLLTCIAYVIVTVEAVGDGPRLGLTNLTRLHPILEDS